MSMASPKKFITRFKLYCRCAHVSKVTSKVTLTFLWEKLSQPQFYKDLTRKITFFEDCPWFKFNNLGLAPHTNVTFYISMVKKLKLKVRTFWELIPTFVEGTGEKPVGDFRLPPSSWIGLNFFGSPYHLATASIISSHKITITFTSTSTRIPSIIFFIHMIFHWVLHWNNPLFPW